MQHSLGIQGTTHIAVTRAAAEQVVAQAPVAGLGEKRLLGATNRPPRHPLGSLMTALSLYHPWSKTGSHPWPPRPASWPGLRPKLSGPTRWGGDPTPGPVL